jgi:hypothetical protein
MATAATDGKEKTSRNGGMAENVPQLRRSGKLGRESQGIKDWSIHIVGSDLLPSQSKSPNAACIRSRRFNGLPPAAIRACFSKIGSAPTGQMALPKLRKTDERFE